VFWPPQIVLSAVSATDLWDTSGMMKSMILLFKTHTMCRQLQERADTAAQGSQQIRISYQRRGALRWMLLTCLPLMVSRR
jgi:hypothetical protein